MMTILSVLLAVSMLGTLGVLFAGMLGLARQDGNAARSNRLMRWRVILQATTLVLFALLLLLRKS
jgi:hypothetical protein